MENPLASTGTTPTNASAQLPKPATPKPNTAPPLALAGSMGGAASAQPAVAPQQSADPLAFAPGAASASLAPAASPAPFTPPAPTPAPTAPVQDFSTYSPIQAATAGLEGAAKEKAITDYWAGQGTQGLAHVGNSFNDKGAYDPAMNAAATSAYKNTNAQSIADITKSVQGNQASSLAAQRANSDALNADQRAQDWDTNAAWNASHFGVTPDPAKARAEWMAGGAGAITPQAGTNLGDRTTTVPGFPGGSPLTPQDHPAGSGSPFGPSTAPNPAAEIAAQTGGNNVALSQIDPENSLISQQITPGQNIDRVKTFQDALNSTRENVLDPARQAAARDLNRYNFGAGRGVSGQARTSQGDLAAGYDRTLADLSAQGLADATRGSIDDNYRNIDETQQERGYQTDRADTAFNQDAQLAMLQENLTNGAFGRADRQQSAGYSDSPDDIGLILSRIFGDQSSQAGQAASESFRNAGNSGGGNGGVDIAAILEALRGGPSGNLNPVVQQAIERGIPGVQAVGD